MTWGCVLLRDDVHVRHRCGSGEHLSSRSEELGSWSGAKQRLSGAGGWRVWCLPPASRGSVGCLPSLSLSFLARGAGTAGPFP